MKRLPTKFEMEQEQKRNKDLKIFGGLCAAIVVIAAGLLLIG